MDQIRRAFKALDAEGKGELSVDEVKKYFGKQGGNSIGNNYESKKHFHGKDNLKLQSDGSSE